MIRPDHAKTIETNAYLQTSYPNIYAVGDVAGPFQFTHTAAHQAWYAAVNALFGRFRRFKADYRVIPWATFTDPEVARVGLSMQAEVDVSRQDGRTLDDRPGTAAGAQTQALSVDEAAAEALVRRVIKANLGGPLPAATR